MGAPVAEPVPPWVAYADTVLQREALLWRLGAGVAPRDLAGWYVTGEDVDRVLAGLPGLDGATRDDAASLRERLAPDLDRARTRLVDDLAGHSRFASLVRSAHLDTEEAATLAVLAAVELSPARQRLVGYLHDDVRLPRVTFALLQRLADAAHCAPDAALVRLALVATEPTGAWATRAVIVADRVLWHLLGEDAHDPALPPRTRLLDAHDREGDVDEPAPSGLLLVHGGDRESRLRQARRSAPTSGLLVTRPPATAEAGLALVREAVVGHRTIVIELDASLAVAEAALVERTPELSWVLFGTGRARPGGRPGRRLVGDQLRRPDRHRGGLSPGARPGPARGTPARSRAAAAGRDRADGWVTHGAGGGAQAGRGVIWTDWRCGPLRGRGGPT